MPGAANAAPPPASKPDEAPAASEPAAGFIWPVDGWIVQGRWAGHPTGIDVGAATGDPVFATRAGKVIFAGGDPCCSYGNYIIIQHDEGWTSLYGHLSAFHVKLGDDVKQGERIGSIGMTGHTDGPHLHFELRSYGGVVDPLSYLSPHRTAPPPPANSPSFVAAPPGGGGPQVAAQVQPTPEAQNGGLSASVAIDAAAPWLASNADASYRLDNDSCHATPSGPNWIVSCRAQLQGCTDASVCDTTLSACVLSQPVLVASIC